MINENQLQRILLIKNTPFKYNNNKTFFGSPLKKFINNIYNKFEIPKESFIISLYYLYNFYNINKNDNCLMKELFDNINIHLFTCIIISLKQLYDENININNICNLLNINYKEYLKIEIIILKGINWNTSFNNDSFEKFKKLMEHYTD